MKTTTTKTLLLTLLLALVATSTLSARPLGKKDYLRRYEKFITKVEADYKTCTDKEWERYNELHKRYSKEYYADYKSELTSEEMKLINDWKASFIYLRTKRGVTGFIDDTKEYVESGEMKSDIENTIDVIGKTAKKAIDDLDE